MNTMYRRKKNNRSIKTATAFLFQISYRQTLSVVVYLVPKQYRICCVHIGVWIYHSVYLTCAYIKHTVYTHTPTCMKAHIYIQYNSQPHHAVTCRLNSTGYFHFLHSVPQWKWSGCSFFRTRQENHDRNTASCFWNPTQKSERRRRRRRRACQYNSLVSGKWQRIQHTATCVHNKYI